MDSSVASSENIYLVTTQKTIKAWHWRIKRVTGLIVLPTYDPASMPELFWRGECPEAAVCGSYPDDYIYLVLPWEVWYGIDVCQTGNYLHTQEKQKESDHQIVRYTWGMVWRCWSGCAVSQTTGGIFNYLRWFFWSGEGSTHYTFKTYIVADYEIILVTFVTISAKEVALTLKLTRKGIGHDDSRKNLK